MVNQHVSGVTVESWKKGYVSSLKVLHLRISGTWMRQGASGKPFQIVVLPKKELHAMLVRKQKSE